MELKKERPDQPRFDHFSRHFEELDARLEDFGRQFGWELIKNPLRKPERDLCQAGEARILFGIYLEGNWLTLDPEAPFLHSAGCTVIYDPVRDVRFLKRERFVEHAPFDDIKADLEAFLHRAVEFAQACTLPILTDLGCYAVPEGWCVLTSESLKKSALENRESPNSEQQSK